MIVRWVGHDKAPVPVDVIEQKGETSMAGNQFASRKFEDFEILRGDRGKIGEIRVKPSGVLWAPKGAHEWFRVNLSTFATFMEKNGRKQKK